MKPRRLQTSPVVDQPVRFYKTVALSFLFLTIALLGIILFMSSKRATIVIVTKENSVSVESLLEVGGLNSPVSVSIATTTVSLSRTFSPTGTKKENGIATGIVTLHNNGNVSQPLIATTRLLTPDGTLFRLKNKVTVPANGIIDAQVYAGEEGEKGNIGPTELFIIPGLREEKQAIIYGSSSLGMTGGVHTIGILGSEDLLKAKKQLLAELETLGKDSMQKKYSSKRGVFKIIGSNISANNETGKEVSEFILSGSASLIGVFYENDEIQSYASGQLLKRIVGDTTILRQTNTEATIELKEFDIGSGTASLAVYSNGVERLNADSKQLQKILFFGKTKEEVRRHILTLDHVHSVDVKFRPLWVRSVPFVPEHVQIIVKTVE